MDILSILNVMFVFVFLILFPTLSNVPTVTQCHYIIEVKYMGNVFLKRK